MPATTSSKLSIVTIEASFGSDLQRDTALKTLADLLAVWKREVESRHKKNKITITEE